jgi:hypothetical protein
VRKESAVRMLDGGLRQPLPGGALDEAAVADATPTVGSARITC